MKPIPEIVKEYVMKTCGRMPQTEAEINEYLDLINHAKEYAYAIEIEQLIGKSMMKKFGFNLPEQIRNKYKSE